MDYSSVSTAPLLEEDDEEGLVCVEEEEEEEEEEEGVRDDISSFASPGVSCDGLAMEDVLAHPPLHQTTGGGGGGGGGRIFNAGRPLIRTTSELLQHFTETRSRGVSDDVYQERHHRRRPEQAASSVYCDSGSNSGERSGGGGGGERRSIPYLYLSQVTSKRALRRRCRSLVPFTKWMPGYKVKEDLKGDVITGITLGIFLVPQGMAYASLAGVPSFYGLYTSITPILVYGFLGTCHHLSFGPFALMSLLVADGLNSAGFDKACTAKANTYADCSAYTDASVAMSLIVGCITIVMNLLNVGIISTFIADPVLSGYTTAAAFLIGASQLKTLFQLSDFINSDDAIYTIFDKIVLHGDDINWCSVAFGLVAVILLLGIAAANKRCFTSLPLPAELMVMVPAILIVWLGGLHDAPSSMNIVGDIPAGLPAPSVPSLSYATFTSLLKPSLVVAVMNYLLAASICKVFTQKHDYKCEMNQELTAMAFCNIIGSFFKCYPASGSLSRGAIISNVGGRTPLHNIISALVVALTLLFLTRLFFYLPTSILASIIIVALRRLFDFGQAKYLWRVNRWDFLTWVVTFLGTLFTNVIDGIIIGGVASLLLLLKGTARPATHTLGRLPGTPIYKSTARFPQAREVPGTIIFQFGATLHFANKDYFSSSLSRFERRFYRRYARRMSALEGIEAAAAAANGQVGEDERRRRRRRRELDKSFAGSGIAGALHTIVLDCSNMYGADSSGMAMLTGLAKGYRERGIQLLVCSVTEELRSTFDRCSFTTFVPYDRMFMTVRDAVQFIHSCGGGAAGEDSDLEYAASSSIDRVAEESQNMGLCSPPLSPLLRRGLTEEPNTGGRFLSRGEEGGPEFFWAKTDGGEQPAGFMDPDTSVNTIASSQASADTSTAYHCL